ncbi:MAG: SDR family NAD(P)-dependent oxidoreductase [Bellilinea sp.]
MIDERPLREKVILIVGAGRPLGRVLALGFARAGAKLALHDLSPIHLDETTAQVQALGAECRSYTGDIGKGLPCRALISDVLDDWRRLDVLVTCLHASPPAGILELDEWDWTRTLELNLTGPFLLAQAAAPVMIQQGGGTIIFVQAGAPVNPSPALTASQAGLTGLAQAASVDLLPYNIKGYAVDVGDFKDSAEGFDPASADAVQLQELAVFLCSPAAVGHAGQVVRPGVM